MNWFIDGSVTMGNLDVYAEDYRVCMIDCDDETVSESDHEANARLIAAAPDLLAALQAIEAYEDNDGAVGSREYEITLMRRQAIAKAKGEG